MTTRSRHVWKLSLVLLISGLLLVVGSPVAAEVQELEAVGTVPIKKGQVATRDTRDAAVGEALREAVLRVARELLIDAAVEEEFDDAALQGVLGKQALPYTHRYRIVEDQGERPSMFGDDKRSSREYVVIVAVSVETELVEQRLVDAGLLLRRAGHGLTTRLRVEIRGLHHYPGYVAVRELIAAESGASAVHPVEFARARAVVDVDLPGSSRDADPEALADRLTLAGRPELAIEVLSVEGSTVVLAATWTPQPMDDRDKEPR